jgi:hypothetical protein
MSAADFTPNRPDGSFLARLRASREALEESDREDPWVSHLRNLRGRVGADGIERIATYDVFDVLEIPLRHRSRLTVRLSRVMRSLGWTNIRARGLTPGSYRDRVRGYAREVPDHPATQQLPNKF